MESPFIYDRYVTGKHFVGRKDSCAILGNLLSNGEHVCIYSPPKTGKKSLIQQTLFNMRIGGTQFVVGEMNLVNVRHLTTFLIRYGATALRSVATTPAEYADLVQRFLGDTHFVFDRRRFAQSEEVVSLNWDPDEKDVSEMLRFPFRIASDRGVKLILILNEFQNLDLTEDGDHLFKSLNCVMKEMRSSGTTSCSMLLCGSKVNAMKNIFEQRRRFHRQVERFDIPRVEPKDIVDSITRGFLSSGKVVEKNLLLGVCNLFRCHLGYIYHFVSVCDSLTKGYITEAVMMDALRILVSIHEPRYVAMMDELTTFQVNLLLAFVDGHTKFSSAEVIRDYGLHSSANVRRLKDALIKKEIVSLNENDEPQIIDPLFDYWVRRYYFEKKPQ